jgi:RHS repeat-associated protein
MPSSFPERPAATARLHRRGRLLVPRFLVKAVVEPLIVALVVASLPQPAQAATPETARAVKSATAASTGPSARAAIIPNRVVPKVQAAPAGPVFSSQPTDAEISSARLFDEPLTPLGAAGRPGENAALATAIRAHLEQKRPEDAAPFETFETFLRAQPDSAWRASLLANLGVAYRRVGYYSRALDRDQQAWDLAKHDTSDAGRAIAFRALGELLELNSRLGRVSDLETLLSQTEGIELSGPITERVEQARQALWLMQNEPGESFRCGPWALDRILASRRADYVTPEKIVQMRSTAQGTSLAQMRALSAQVGLRMTAIHRDPGSGVPVPSIVHWRAGHFAAIVRESAGRYLVEDPTFIDEVWVTAATLDEESSGAFLTSAPRTDSGWKELSDDEAQGVWGKGGPGGQDPGYQGPKKSCKGLAVYGIQESLGALSISDIPITYSPARGPSISFQISYNQRDVFQPQTFTYSNVGPKWTFDWLSYVEDDPGNPAQAAKVYLRGGGQETYNSYNPTTQSYAPQFRSHSTLVRVSSSPIRYERRLVDGSVEVFAQPVGAFSVPRKILLTQLVDSRGDTLTFVYDGLLRLVALVDATGQVTSLGYQNNGDYLKIRRITDPYGRAATLDYDGSGKLVKITDVMGLTSEFGYGAGDFVTSLTTPDGTTHFEWGTSGAGRWIQVTDPLGGMERTEAWLYSFAYPDSDPAGAPAGIANGGLLKGFTAHWDKRAMAVAAGQISSAEITNWLWTTVVTGIPYAKKRPLESRVWYVYPGQHGHYPGPSSQPIRVTRLLGPGIEQNRTYEYNQSGMLIKSTDPVGRETVNIYGTVNSSGGNVPDPVPSAGLGLDLLQVKQKRDPSNPSSPYDILSSTTYNARHQPLTTTDAAGQVTTYTYDSMFRPDTVVTPPHNGPTGSPLTPSQRTTTYEYFPETASAGAGQLKKITGPGNGMGEPSPITQYEYDGEGRMRQTTDPDGRITSYQYDTMDRPTRTTYMDGTYEETQYNRLDAEAHRDRLGRWSHTFHDALRRVTATRDALGRTTNQFWCSCGSLDRLVDPNGNATVWERDLQGRVIKEIHPDGKATEYTYADTTSRLREKRDARNQVARYSYFYDETVKDVTYIGAVEPTATVSYTYDRGYNRIATMVDGLGTTTYAYYPIDVSPSLGAGQLASVDGSQAGDTITYTYDELGQIKSRTDPGGPSGTGYAYDRLGRLAGLLSGTLGWFTYAYDGVTNRVTDVTFPNGQTSHYTYGPVAADSRLLQIKHRLSATDMGPPLSQFDYTYDVLGNIKTWRQQLGTAPATQYELGYDAADQLKSATLKSTDPTPVVLKRYGYAYDPAGNRTANQTDDVGQGASYNTRNQLVSAQPGGTVLFRGTVNEPATVTVQSTPMAQPQPADVGAPPAPVKFEGGAVVGTGTTLVTVKAKDAAGNERTANYNVTESGATATFSYFPTGELVTQIGILPSGGGTKVYAYDANGRLTRATIENMTPQETTFVYDGLGRRVKKISGSTTWVYIYDGDEIVEERHPRSASQTRFVHGLGIDQRLAQYTIGSTPEYLLTDHLGSVWQKANSAGTVTLTRQYDLWGNLTAGASSGYAFTGREWDAETGLYYYRARYYDPKIGRFISEDPLAPRRLAGVSSQTHGTAASLYAYVSGNPLTTIDPTGLVDLNLMSEKFNRKEHRAAELSSSYLGHITVAGHGNPSGVYDLRSSPSTKAAMYSSFLSVEQLAALIRPLLHDGCPVDLLICEVGAARFAKKLAKLLEVDVWAPATPIVWDEQYGMSPNWPAGQYWGGKLHLYSWKD